MNRARETILTPFGEIEKDNSCARRSTTGVEFEILFEELFAMYVGLNHVTYTRSLTTYNMTTYNSRTALNQA